MASPATRSARATLAVRTRDHGPDASATIQARRALDVEALADHINAVVDAAPPLSAAQRDRLAVLLRGGSALNRRADAGPRKASAVGAPAVGAQC